MKRKTFAGERGSTLVVTIIVVVTLLVLLGVAVDYTTQISRLSQRSRKTGLAMEIADGHLETLFTSWRNIYRTTWTTTSSNSGGTDYSLCGTNFFYTADYHPSPAPTAIPQMSPAATPPQIPRPSPSNFPSEANYTIAQYRIQAVDPMIDLDVNGNATIESNQNSKGSGGGYVAMSTAAVPPAGYGPNTWQYSFFYLAAVDVSVPAMTGSVTAKVRRLFEKKFDQPWTYAMFYVDDLELHPSTPLTITGPVHTNSSLYIGTSNFTAASFCEYGSDFVNGYSAKDPRYPGSGFTAPNFAKSDPSLTLSDCPPSQVSPYLPFGWNLNLSAASGGGTNDDSYHEILERPASGTDSLANVRYYNQPGYRIVINPDTYNADGTVNTVGAIDITSIDSTGAVTTIGGATKNKLIGNNGSGSSTTVVDRGNALYDARQGGAVKVTNFNVAELISNLNSLNAWTGLVYITDAGATIYNADGSVKTAGTSAPVTINGVTTWTTKRAIRLVNGYALPSPTASASVKPGLTLVSENPVYIQGNYNTGSTSSASVPSNSGTYTDPDASGYTRQPAAIVADAITVLSGGWNDSNSAAVITSRVATANMTVNAALVAGNVPSNVSHYSGGGENFIRLLEDWSSRTFCYYGSMVQLFASNQAIGFWNGDGTVYSSPGTTKWYYDDTIFSSASPPGNLQIAAYLQQQRWYQVY